MNRKQVGLLGSWEGEQVIRRVYRQAWWLDWFVGALLLVLQGSSN